MIGEVLPPPSQGFLAFGSLNGEQIVACDIALPDLKNPMQTLWLDDGIHCVTTHSRFAARGPSFEVRVEKEGTGFLPLFQSDGIYSRLRQLLACGSLPGKVALADGTELMANLFSPDPAPAMEALPFSDWVTPHIAPLGKDTWRLGGGVMQLSHGVVRNPRKPGEERRVRFSVTRNGRLIGLTEEGQLLFWRKHRPQSEDTRIELQAVELGDSDALAASPDVAEFPKGHVVSEAQVSPDGSAIAWLLVALDWSHAEIFVSDRHGGALRHLPGASCKVALNGNLPCNLKWVPGGLHLSYVHEGALWRVEV
jgi:hypothetical protein